jgi:hypothetical protein
MIFTSLFSIFITQGLAEPPNCSPEQIQEVCTDPKKKLVQCALPGDFDSNKETYCTNSGKTKSNQPPKNLENSQIQPKPQTGKPVGSSGTAIRTAEKHKNSQKKKTASPQDKELNSSANSTAPIATLVSILLALIALLVGGFSLLQGKKHMSSYQEFIQSLNQRLEKQSETIKELQSRLQTRENEALNLESKVQELKNSMANAKTSSKPKPSGVSLGSSTQPEKKPKGLNLGGQSKHTASKNSHLANTFSKLKNFWNSESQGILEIIPSAGDFDKRVIQHSEHFISKLNSEELNQDLLDNTLILILDQMAILQSRLAIVQIQGKADTSALRKVLSKLLYDDFGNELQNSSLGQLMNIKPGITSFDMNQHSATNNANIGAQYVDKVLEVEKVGIISVNGRKVIRKAKVIVGA